MKFRIPAAITLSLLLSSQAALAEIINAGNSIIDTESGLEWLDLTETRGLSWNEAEASHFVTVDGYSHASAIAVGELMINAGFLTIENKNEPGNDAAAQLLLSFLGCTQFCGTINATGRGFAFYNDVQTVRPNYHTGGLGSGATTISLFSLNKDLRDPTAGHYLVRVADTTNAPWLLQGYLSEFSVAQGSDINLYISANSARVDIAINRRGLPRRSPLYANRTVASYTDVAVIEQPAQPDAWSAGAGWSQPLTIPIADDWPSGFYEILMSNSVTSTSVFFVVKEDEPGSTSDILMIDTATTQIAYNGWGGRSLYNNRPPASRKSSSVSLARPNQHKMPYQERKFIRWATYMGINLEYASSLDLHNNPALLDPYSTVVTVGHAEYWSKEMRDTFDAFVARGGNAMILSGNTMYWQVRFEDNQMVCYKDPGTDPLIGINNALVTDNWFDDPINDPENRSIGVSWRSGGYVNWGAFLPAAQGYGGLTVAREQHPLLAGTGLVDGDTFGTEHTIAGYEVDGAVFEWVDGVPEVTGSDGTPLNFEILAYTPAEDFDVPGYGTTGVFQVETPENPGSGGKVFNAATIDWADGLWEYDRDRLADSQTSKIMLNVVNEFSPGSLPSCSIDGGPGDHDSDRDGVYDICDNCVAEYNPGQADDDGDGTGNTCEVNVCH